MFLYKIYLNKNYFELKYPKIVLEYDVYHSAIICCENSKECREFAFKELNGSETRLDLINKNSNLNYNNKIWKNSKYTSLKKIGIPLNNIKKGIILSDYLSG